MDFKLNPKDSHVYSNGGVVYPTPSGSDNLLYQFYLYTYNPCGISISTLHPTLWIRNLWIFKSWILESRNVDSKTAAQRQYL